jgi:hypothetical protein
VVAPTEAELEAMLGSLVGFGFSGVSALMQNIAQRVMGA